MVVHQSEFLRVLCGVSFANFAVKSSCSRRNSKTLTAEYAKKKPQSARRNSNSGTIQPMRTLTFVGLLMCLGMAASSAQEIQDPHAESTIMALERIAKLQAYENRDLKTLDAIFDEAFVHVDQEGRLLTKAELMASIQAADSVQYAVEAMVVKMHGDTAIVTGLYQMKGVEHGRAFVRKGRFVDTWLYKKGRWVEIAGLSTPGGN